MIKVRLVYVNLQTWSHFMLCLCVYLLLSACEHSLQFDCILIKQIRLFDNHESFLKVSF